jgi:hypothetical protein
MNKSLPLRDYSIRSRVARGQSQRRELVANVFKVVSEVAHLKVLSNQDPTLFATLRNVFTSFVRRLTNSCHPALSRPACARLQ